MDLLRGPTKLVDHIVAHGDSPSRSETEILQLGPSGKLPSQEGPFPTLVPHSLGMKERDENA